MSVTIKRYPNRKLYNTETKRYITLDGIATLIKQGEEISVIDHASEEDLTTLTLTQIIFEQEKKGGGFLPRNVLTGLIQAGGETLGSLRRTMVAPLQLFGPVEEEIDRRLQALIGRGELAREEGVRLRDKLIGESWHNLRGRIPNSADLESMLTKRNIPLNDDLKSLFSQFDSISDRINELINPDEETEESIEVVEVEAEQDDAEASA